MPIKKIKISIKNEEQNDTYVTKAIINEETIKYQEKDNTTALFLINENTLIRENKEIKMRYQFALNKKTKGTIYIRELNKEIEIPIKTIVLKNDNGLINIKYKINNELYHYRIEEIK